ncbi:MAG: hypothetical protein KAS59_00815 [Alphaproteobacteria bacterium]|nr:hypothetical protein [Alphaproteobacteria bacterium]
MKRAKIISPKSTGYFIGTSTKNTSLSQPETLEEIMINLSTYLGVKEIHKQTSARDATFYEPQEPLVFSYQSASNTLLELSRKILELKD